MIELSAETEALAHRLAMEQELSVDETIRQALEARDSVARLAALSSAAGDILAARRRAIDDMIATVATAPTLDPRSPHDIMDDLDPL